MQDFVEPIYVQTLYHYFRGYFMGNQAIFKDLGRFYR